MLLDKVRVMVGDALHSDAGDRYKPIKLVRAFLGTANDLAGRPFCTAAELADRRGGPAATGPAARREPAPVMVYFDGKDHRTKQKVEELLRGRDIAFQVLDVTDDESTRSWAQTQAKLDEFPLVFVAGEALGGLHELTQADVNGTLKKKVFG
jgi:glutaredoxin-related protein